MEPPRCRYPFNWPSWPARGTARSFIATESTILRAEQAKRQQQGREIALRVATARNEVEALKRKLEQVDVQKDLNSSVSTICRNSRTAVW